MLRVSQRMQARASIHLKAAASGDRDKPEVAPQHWARCVEACSCRQPEGDRTNAQPSAAAGRTRGLPEPAVAAARARRPQDLLRKFRITHRHADARAIGYRPRSMHAHVVRPEGRTDRAGDPIGHDVGQHRVAAETAVEIAAAIAPGVEFFDDPGRTRNPEGRDLFIDWCANCPS